MAKKFALVQGIHNIFDYQIQNDKYIYNISRIQKNELVDKNTVGFYIVDNEDVNRYIGDHKITEKDRFIITQNDVFSLYGSLETEIEQPDIIENTWRPVLVNDEYINEPFNIDYKDGELTKANHIIENVFDTTYLSLKYDINKEALINFLKENLDAFVELPNVGNGELTFNIDKTTVFTANSVEIDNPDYNEEDPNSSQTIETHNVDIDQNTLDINGSFTANSVDDSVVKIKYKGTADRVDWYVTNENRDNRDDNNSKAKKFVYIDCLQKCFEASSDYPYLIIKDEAKDIISEDSIVFITCGKIIKDTDFGIFEMTDAEVFDNPEYVPGARFIWTHGMMFSANTWMPIFTRETIDSPTLNDITRVIGNTHLGGRLIFQGAGGIKVDNTQNGSDVAITIDGSGITRGEMGELGLQDGVATNITSVVGGMRVDVLAKEGEYGVTDHSQVTKKNFIQIKQGTDSFGKKESWIEVNGMDAKSIFIEEEIPIGGTKVGNAVNESGSFSDCGNKIPVGMSLHEVLYRILYKEETDEDPSGDGSLNETLKVNNPKVTIKAWYRNEDGTKGKQITTTEQLPIGTKVIIEITCSGTAEQTVTLDFCQYGAISEPKMVPGTNVTKIDEGVGTTKAYRETYTPTVNYELNTTITGCNQIGDGELNDSTTTYVVEVTSNGTNKISATNTVTGTQDPKFVPHTLWRATKWGNKVDPETEFWNATNQQPVTGSASASLTLNVLFPYFIGIYKPQTEGNNYFDFENATAEEIKNEIIGNVKDNTDVAVDKCGYIRYNATPSTDAVTFTPNNLFGIYNQYGPAQLVFVVPKYALDSKATLNNWITLKDAIMNDITTIRSGNLDYLFKPISLFSGEEDYYLYTNFNKGNKKGLGGGNLTYQFKNIK